MEGTVDQGTETYVLSAGLLTLSISHQAQDELFRVAERQNPKRAFLFISTLLGRHIPVAPSAHRAAILELTERILTHVGDGDVFVMSYAETAIGLGLGVFDILETRIGNRLVGYLPTTRLRPEGISPWFTTREEHSHAADHMIFHPGRELLPEGPDSTLVLVDDETTTGNTFAGLAEGLGSVGLQPSRVVLATLTDWSDGQSAEAVSRAFPQARINAVSLLSGAYSWSPATGGATRSLPPGCSAACPNWTPAAGAPFGVPRTGLGAEAHRTNRADWRAFVDKAIIGRIASGVRVLVIGSGEHVWHPFLAAEQIEQAGHETCFISTTRSPVARGPVVPHQFTFPDHYGIGMPMYLNNVRPGTWDELLLFTETGMAGVPNTLRAALGKGWIFAADGIVPMTEETA